VLPGASDRDGSAGSKARLQPESLAPARATALVEAEGPGYAIFSRTYFPAWKARVDGQDARVLVANARELAVAVPAGSHRVEFEWDGAPFRLGVTCQALALVGLLGLAAAGRRLRASE